MHHRRRGQIGERVYNSQQYYNNLPGFGEGSDSLPERFLKEPWTTGGSVGHVCELDLMLEEFYTARGWRNGVVPKENCGSLKSTIVGRHPTR